MQDTMDAMTVEVVSLQQQNELHQQEVASMRQISEECIRNAELYRS